MKKQILFIIALIFANLSIGQNGGFNYKALITDNGNVLASHSVIFKFTVLENGSTAVYQEMQSATTDPNGIVALNIGEGTVISGDFTTIDWGSNPHFLKVEIDTGSGYQDFGTSELKAVPYAKFAEKAGNTFSGNFSDLSNKPITFYKVGTTAQPTNINDFIYTYGRIGLGTSNPGGQLEINGDGQDARLILASSTNNGPNRPGIQFKNNTSQYIAGDDQSDEIFGFYSQWGNNRTYNAKIRVYGKAVNNWGKYIEIKHDGVDGKIRTDTGNITFSPAGNEVVIEGKITASATGSNDLKVFAYGTIDFNGSILSGTENFHVDHNLGAGIYKITFNGENYDNNHFTTIVSVKSMYWPSFIFSYATNNTLVVKIFKSDGSTKEDKAFSFVTYKN